MDDETFFHLFLAAYFVLCGFGWWLCWRFRVWEGK